MVEINHKIPTTNKFLQEKKINDIIYGYIKLHSFIDNGVRMAYKIDCSAAKIKKYMENNIIEKQLPETVKAPSENTIRNVINFLLIGNWIQLDKFKNKQVYILPKLDKGTYVEIKSSTLQYLIDTASVNIIKAYAYLKLKFYFHNKYHKEGEPFHFSKKSLLEAIGYNDETDNKNLKMIENLLVCLQNNNLIEIERRYTISENGTTTYYYYLLNVNEDYKNEIARPKTKKELEYPDDIKTDSQKYFFNEFVRCF